MWDDTGVMTTLDDGRQPTHPRPEPANRLAPRARAFWRLNELVQVVPLLAAASAATWVLGRFPLPGWVLFVPVGAAAVLAILTVMVAPELRWRHWRYEIGDDEVDVQHGLVTVIRTLIPLARIQHVETRRGPLERRLGLASVVLYTAAGSSEIPALADGVADALRDRIAALARTESDV